MATYNLNSSIPSASSLKTGDILNCPYNGSYKTITLPKGTYLLECWGAQGGYRSSSTYGGKGGYAKGTLTLTANTTLYLYAGGAGNTGGSSGGFNGGGARYSYSGGGGGSDIRIGQDSYYARVIVAGGGGSDGATYTTGGAGGGTNGQANQGGGYGSGGYYGTQTGLSSGSPLSSKPTSNSSSNIYGGFGFGGYGCYRSSGYGGAGGGGWYGGCGTYPDGSGDDDKSGGGGSGYVYTSATAGNYPSGCLLNSNYYLTSTTLVDGTTSFTDYSGSTVTGHSGDGAVRITCTNIIPDIKPPTNIKLIRNKSVLTVSWTAPSGLSGITGYTVEPYKDGVLGTTLSSTTTSVNISISQGGSYYVKVKTVVGNQSSTAASSNTLAVDTVPAINNLTVYQHDGTTYLNWDAVEGDNIQYRIRIRSLDYGMYVINEYVSSNNYVYLPGREITGEHLTNVQAYNVSEELYSTNAQVSFTCYLPSPPTNFQGSIDDSGIATITWTPSTDNSTTGYTIFMLEPDAMQVGRSPMGKPLFEFPFSNESLVSPLLILSEYLENSFVYQLKPRTTYKFTVSSRSDSHPGGYFTSTSLKTITFYYESSLKFSKVKLTPTPAFVSESVLIEVGVNEEIVPTITTN